VIVRLSLVVLTGALVMSSGAASAQPVPDVAAAYTSLYRGHLEEARGQFARARTARPETLPPWFGSLFSQMALLEYDDSVADAFERDIDAFIEEATRRYERASQDSEALFYLVQGHLLRGTYRFAYDKGMWGAARDGAKSKGYADEYLRRHPEHGDAYLAPALYNYFVDIAPAFIKVLRVLLFLPSGNRTRGLEQLQRAAADGNLFAPFAQITLADIYGSFEGRVREAITLSERYIQRFPENAEVRLDLASRYMHPRLENFARAEAGFRHVLQGATGDTPRHLSQRHSALLGLASLRRAQWRLPEAIELLDAALAQPPEKPDWILPTLLLRRGNYRMLINDASALSDIRRVRSDSQMGEWHDAADRLRRSYNERVRGKEGPVYAALIPGNQLVAAHRFDEAGAEYEKVAVQYPNDWQVRYRQAYLEFARERYDAAAVGMHAIVSSSASMPDWVKSAAMLHLAYTHDLSDRRDDALELYRRIVDNYEDDGSAAAARIGLLTPYRGRP
jgi:tetratricopeptide (TPR) repeat protein